MHYVTNVTYAGDHKLWIQFEDGAPRLVDLRLIWTVRCSSC